MYVDKYVFLVFSYLRKRQSFDFKLDNQLDLIYLNGKLTLVSYAYPWVILLSLVIPFQLKLVY